MSITEDFLTSTEEQEIVQAIQKAENMTSGEIRVHIEAHSDVEVMLRAQEVFFALKMNETVARNGVLFYVGVATKSFAIIGDQGIDQVVSPTFWEATKNTVLFHFKQQHFKEGLIAGVLSAGEALQKYFPNESDKNELSNEISKG